MERNDCTVGDYLLTRLKQIGVDHLFGVPGDFVLAFFNQVLNSDVRTVPGSYAAWTAAAFPVVKPADTNRTASDTER